MNMSFKDFVIFILVILIMIAIFISNGDCSVDDKRVIVIRTIMMEALGEGEDGMLEVANVIRNRVDSIRWPNDPYDVVMQKWQFSCNNGDHYKNWVKFKTRNKVDGGDWMRASRAWEISRSLSGDNPRTKNRFTLYHRSDITPKDWDFSLLTEGKKIGNHIFYRYINEI